MRILLVGDIHLTDRPPSTRRESFAEQVLAKLEHTVDLADVGAADAVVWAGDVFHIKTPSRTSHRLVQRTIEVLRSYPCETFIVPGNHDLRHDDLDTLDEQPLGTLFKAQAATPLMGNVTREWGDLFGIPFLKRWTDLPEWFEGWQDSGAPLMVTHAPIVPPSSTLPYDVIHAEEWVAKMGRSGACYYGHMHHCDGAYRVANEHGEVWMCNQGALSRGSLHHETIARKPAVTWFETEPAGEEWDGPFLRVEVPHEPADEVFDLARVQAEEDTEQRLESFLEALGSTTLTKVTAEAIAADMAEREDVDDEVAAAVSECVEAVL